MRDVRVQNLARILVEHSAAVKEGDVCTIEGGSAAEPRRTERHGERHRH